MGAHAQVDAMSESRIVARRRARRIANNGMAVAGGGSAGTTASTVLFAATANPLLAVGVGFALGVFVGMVVAKSAA
jgi:hypothetical protein